MVRRAVDDDAVVIDHDRRANRYERIQLFHVFLMHADTAIGHVIAYGGRIIGPMNTVGTVKADPAIAQGIVGASRNLYGRIAGVDPCRVDFLRLHAVKAGRRRCRRRADAYVIHAYLFAVFIQNEHAAGCVDADFPSLLRLLPGLRRRFRRGLLDFYRYVWRRFRLHRHYRIRSLLSGLDFPVFTGLRSGFAVLPSCF